MKLMNSPRGRAGSRPVRPCRWLRTAPGWLTIIAAYSGMLASASSAPGADPDPRALLRGVEAARNGIKSGRVELVVDSLSQWSDKRNPRPTRLLVAFDGANCRFDQFTREMTFKYGLENADEKLKAMDYDREAFARADLGTFRDEHIRSSWDGEWLVQYSNGGGACIRDEKKGSGYYIFDIRTLGINSYHGMVTNVARSLDDRANRTLALVGREDVAGHPTWHVRMVDQYADYSSEFHLWIEDVPGFPVWKTEENSPYQKTTVTCEYASPVAEKPLPTLVHALTFDRDGRQIGSHTIRSEKAELNITVDPDAWSLASMGIPLGGVVSDERIHQIAGYFDGVGLRANINEALHPERVDLKHFRP